MNKHLIKKNFYLGTGKTTTLIEAVIQITKTSNLNRILICAPSNTAADHFAISLAKTGQISKSKILRLFSASHEVAEKQPELLELTYRS